MSEPTQEQIREFWEWCGQLIKCYWCKGSGKRLYSWSKESTYLCPCCDAKGFHHPSIDLNNLFKYAVPKLQDKEYWLGLFNYRGNRWSANIINTNNDTVASEDNEDPALALFWALWRVRCQVILLNYQDSIDKTKEMCYGE